MRTIENLVFKGGGVLGIAYAGAIETLEEKNILATVKRTAGTSAGSIMAALVALKHTAAEIKEIVHSTDFKDFEDHWDPLRIPGHYGLYKGDYFLKWMRNIIKNKTGNPDLTFKELTNQGYLDLHVFATDLNICDAVCFSNETTPDVKIAESIRASMSIPLFFSAWQFPDGNPNDHIYVDGGTVYNYPINAFPNRDETLGFFLYSKDQKVNDLKYHELLTYTKLLFQTALNAQNIDFEEDSLEKKITVKIDDFGISAVDFHLNDDQKKQLFNSGKEATLAYLSKEQS